MNAHAGVVTLDDKYLATQGQVYLTGIQALVRLPLDRARLDRAGGLKTGGFISGYRGSPLAGYDTELARAKRHLAGHDVVFRPGVNEELGATAVWGSQKVRQHGKGSDYDGVFGIWYGKAPGVDRAGDVLKQANASGVDAHGGVLALAGDDHLAKSSILPAQSEFFFEHAEIPVLNPADIQEVLDYGLHGLELSRHCGLWSALICVADTMDASATISVDAQRLAFVRPEQDPRAERDLNRVLLLGNRLETERLLRDVRVPAAQAYVRANRLDRVAFGASRPRLGIVATGKAYRDLRQALDLLGIGEARARALGLAVYKVAMPWPLEPTGLAEFGRGLARMLVVEHKRAFLESQIKEISYHWPETSRPRIWGKRTPDGEPFLSDVLELSVAEIVEALLSWLPQDAVSEEMQAVSMRMTEQVMWAQGHAERAARTPYFCSGCPHSTSTRTPEGSRSMPGIGCHAMTEVAGRTTDGQIAMGGEGALWVGQKDFARDGHVFANLGDGTYFHSGILAIRQALSAGVPITYKILYNDAVAMTGGQRHDGQLSVPQITRQLEAEGVEKIAVISETPDAYLGRKDLAPGTAVHHRDDLMSVQEAFQAHPGVSVIVYDQTCAAEKRRRRKKGTFPDPDRRLFINDRVCEGCGDCSVQSNCLSVEPLKTPFGDKRQINQSSCNKDFTCIKGFCPSFVEIEGASLRKATAKGLDVDALVAGLPAVTQPGLERTVNLLVAGIGGMGVTTISAVLAMAAHLDGKQASTLDMTGLAQKGGPVTSHVRFAAGTRSIEGPRVPTASLDVLIASDMVVATNAEQLALANRSATQVFANTRVAPTAEFVLRQTQSFDEARMLKALQSASVACHAADVAGIAEALLGDAIYANMMLVGMAWQAGVLPVSAEAIETALHLNGASVAANVKAFRAGRVLLAEPDRILSALPSTDEPAEETLEAKIGRLADDLTAYQDAAYAARYAALVERVRAADAAFGPGTMRLTETVADMLYKVMAYKDEYEVARLHADPAFRARIAARFDDPRKIKVWLAPPLLARRLDERTGRPAKIAFGPWIFGVFGVLARMRRLRGTAFDPFGRTAERKAERALIEQYVSDVETVIGHLGSAGYGLLVEIARVPDLVRGFGPVKEANLEKAAVKRAQLLDRLEREHARGAFADAAE
ncbi:indolepyruvate ferredoxin oxidoreductase family protein [Polymorphum gilvum]|uniref:2-oxoacid:ferredoxin/flavodoxin oxidoreductase, gamma subunit domain protein n=1 Tax=Polymorphum gilvum (strain LMG 25793 / CGMCC 1.9160 / SL003B-26A1) TaxID=991905 RepID=F2J4Y0_POLGS|nr:indolepyruvate ferredoxin oxidoreductase family protein [Polymorphum gilvum]ADZ70022.1 2-oxoacid:ferredoxin/flavodoxin oxidoreductase, gamma subunit domain protein [Polymorphum gilvum SL003B-26A1]